MIVQTSDPAARDHFRAVLQRHIDDGNFSGARVHVSHLLFGPPVRFPVQFRVVGPDLDRLRTIAQEVRVVMARNPHVRDAYLDWGERVPTTQLVFDHDRLSALGLSPRQAAHQLHGLLNGLSVTQVREGTRGVDVVLRGAPRDRRGLADVGDLTLRTNLGESVPLRQVARLETLLENPLLKRYDSENYIAVQADVSDTAQPPDVTVQILPALAEIKRGLPPGYRIDIGGSVEESGNAYKALAVVFPMMIVLMLLVIMVQVRSFSTMSIVFATAPLGLVGAVPVLLLFGQEFGFNAILGLIGLAAS